MNIGYMGDRMKKVKKFLLGNIKTVVAFILGIIISGTGVYAATIIYNSNQVGYDNTSSGMSATNVQDALDELYTKANTWINPNNNFGTPQYYAFGAYKGWCSSTDKNCNSFADFPATSTTPPSGKNVYGAKYADGGYGVCIKRNGKEHCFRGRNWIAEAQHVQKVFSDVSCNVRSSYVSCIASDFSCGVYSNGTVDCDDLGTFADCGVDARGSVDCSE